MEIAYQQLISERPAGDKVEDFIRYFEKTWIKGDYPVSLWNHLNNNGPRTNNHLEGDNRKTNSEMPSETLNIYQFIDFNKILESEVFINFHRRENSCKFNTKRRPIDIKRDERIRNLKSSLTNSLISSQFSEVHLILQFVRSIAHMYQYERRINDEGDEFVDKSSIELSMPSNSDMVRLQNSDSHLIKIVPVDALKELRKKFTMVSRFGINLTHLDLDSLNPQQWLNDNVINYYLNLLTIGLNKSCYLFNTFFWLKMSDSVPSVDSWFCNLNLFAFRFHLIPIHLNGNHWMLICVDTHRSKVTLFDSFLGFHPSVLEKIKEFYNRHHFKTFGAFLSDIWVFEHASSIPTQKNSFDCGVFVCKFAELYLRESTIYYFLSRDCEYFRKGIMYSLILNEFF